MKRKILALSLAALLLFTGCGKRTGTSGTMTAAANAVRYVTSDVFTERDRDAAYENAVTVTLNGGSASCGDDGVSIDGSTVNIVKAGVYLLTGRLTGQVAVAVGENDKVQIVLSGAAITAKDGAAILVTSADKVFLTLAAGTENTLTSTALSDDSIDGVIFSKEDLTIGGSGALTVTSPNHGIVCKDDLKITGGTLTVTAAGHGIDANDSADITGAVLNVTAERDGIHVENTEEADKGFFYMESGTVTVTAGTDGVSASSYAQIDGGVLTVTAGGGAANAEQKVKMTRPGQQTTETSSSVSAKGLKAGAAISVTGGSLTFDTADDALHANGNIDISGGVIEAATGDDGIHADDTLTVTAGSAEITESYEGLEAQVICINGGDIRIKASDDGLNAAGGTDGSGMQGPFGENFGGDSDASITIAGGKLVIDSDGDGVDANGTVAVTGGVTLVSGATNNGNAALDYDGAAYVTGGVFIATGMSGMAQNFSSASEQASVIAAISAQQGGTSVALVDGSGKVIACFTPEKSYNCVLFSSPDITAGGSYTVMVGGTADGADENGFATGAALTGGTSAAAVTA